MCQFSKSCGWTESILMMIFHWLSVLRFLHAILSNYSHVFTLYWKLLLNILYPFSYYFFI